MTTRILIFALIILFNSSKAQKFNNYYYNINMAIYAKRNNNLNLSNKYLYRAFNKFPKQNDVPIPDWIYAKVISYVYSINKKKAINIICNNKVLSDKTKFLEKIKDNDLKEIVNSKQEFYNYDFFYLKKHKELTALIDTIISIDQYICKNKKNIDTLLVKEEYKKIDGGKYGSNIVVFEKLKNLLSDYELFGNYSCQKCSILLPMVHITNFDYFEKINDKLQNLVKKGFLTPNEYAWAFDRSYNQKYGTFYYYFSMNNAFNTSNYIPQDKLNKKQIKEINNRRKQIGIPALPFSFEFIAPMAL